MVSSIIQFKLSYTGNIADQHEIDFYDVAKALIGFERSLALTTHLVLNGEVITQAPFLSGARIAARPAEIGSWEFFAAIYLIGKGAYRIGTTPRDTPLGHLISSAYDYIVSHITGVHVDYATTLGAQLDEMREGGDTKQNIPQHKLDALAEKCETAVSDIHRPIIKSKSAEHANISARLDDHEFSIGPEFDEDTFDYISYTKSSDMPVEIVGRVSSYNMNSFKGRIYVSRHGRPISFELSESTRDNESVTAVAESLSQNVQTLGRAGNIRCSAFELLSRTGVLKKYLIVDVFPNE